MFGLFNRILRIDLTQKKFSYEAISDELLRKSLGGKGLGVHLLLENNPPAVAPLAPANRFIITVGPATGTKLWGQSRFGVYSKSPATSGYGESYCGGELAPKIKGCGVDAIIIHGKCDELSFLVIDEQGVTFEDASELKGKDTFETEDHILGKVSGNAGAMTIGPAGENLVAFACIKADKYRSLGRGGMGAVLGSKNIKGLAFLGQKQCPIADGDFLKQIIKHIAQKGKESPSTKLYQTYGTAMQVAVTNTQKCFPTRYWSSGYFEKWETLSADYMHENFEVKRHGCPNCFLQCTKAARVKHGRHKGLVLDGPEFETIYALGGLNAIEGLEEVAWLNLICDKLGIDTMSAGNISAFSVEAYKRGKIDFQIDYNQPDKIAELLELITGNEGVGKIFVGGIKQAAEQLGLEDIAVHVKGLEPAGFDPRGLKGMGLSYATAARGACHLRGTFYKAELSGEIDRDQTKGKAELMIDYEDRCTIFDSLILCRFFRDLILWDELMDIIRALTGLSFTKKELQVLANDITQLTREYNKREGLDSSTDTLPKSLLQHANKEGACLSDDDLSFMVQEYNKIRASRR